MGLLRTLVSGTIGMALGGPVGAICVAMVVNDIAKQSSHPGYDDGSDVGDSGSGLGDTCDE